MKAKLRKTGEIVEIIAYSGITTRSSNDCVSYIDSSGVEHQNVKGLNRYWDFEDVPEEAAATEKETDWQAFRAKAAKDVLCTLLLNARISQTTSIEKLVSDSIAYADKLIEQLSSAS